MLKKIFTWYNEHREKIDVASIMIIIFAIIYLIVAGVNGLLVSFLVFTGLKFLVWGIVGGAIGNTAWTFYKGKGER